MAYALEEEKTKSLTKEKDELEEKIKAAESGTKDKEVIAQYAKDHDDLLAEIEKLKE